MITRPIRELSLAGLLVGSLAATTVSATEFSLFGDLTLIDDDTKPSSFALGALDFYVTQEISDRTTGFVELVVAGEDSGEFEAEIERLWIRYEVSSAFRIAAGRFHTPLGYWNRTFHHGALLQDTVERPFFLEWEDDGGILPTHIVGLMATGEAWAGLGTFRYELVVGNGQELNSEAGLDPAADDRPELDPNNVGDRNDDKSVGVRLALDGDSGWQVGVFGLTQEVAESGELERGALVAAGESLVRQDILGLDLLYEGERFGFLGEYFEIDDETLFGDSARHESTAFYLQAWYDLSETWRLTYRHSSLDLDPRDAYFRLLSAHGQDHDLLTLVFRRDEVSVIKLEIDRLSARSPWLEDGTAVRAQWAFLIP